MASYPEAVLVPFRTRSGLNGLLIYNITDKYICIIMTRKKLKSKSQISPDR